MSNSINFSLKKSYFIVWMNNYFFLDSTTIFLNSIIFSHVIFIFSTTFLPSNSNKLIYFIKTFMSLFISGYFREINTICRKEWDFHLGSYRWSIIPWTCPSTRSSSSKQCFTSLYSFSPLHYFVKQWSVTYFSAWNLSRSIQHVFCVCRIRVPYPFQWGAPTFDASEAFAMMMASFVALVEVISFFRTFLSIFNLELEFFLFIN